MLIVMRNDSPETWLKDLTDYLERLSVPHEVLREPDIHLVAIVTHVHNRSLDLNALKGFRGVERVVPLNSPTNLSRRDFTARRSLVRIGKVEFGGPAIPIVAGACLLEAKPQFEQIAREVKRAGATVLAANFVKGRTSPYKFRGIGPDLLPHFPEVRRQTELPIVSEVASPADLELVGDAVDAVRVGPRSLFRFDLLREIGRRQLPVILDRDSAATADEWLLAAEHILNEGNFAVILCECGIRTIETTERNALDICSLLTMRQLTHLPLVVDPSHATGRSDLVNDAAVAAVVCGCDGVLVDVHPQPERALAGGAHSLTFANLNELVHRVHRLASVIGRYVPSLHHDATDTSQQAFWTLPLPPSSSS